MGFYSLPIVPITPPVRGGGILVLNGGVRYASGDSDGVRAWPRGGGGVPAAACPDRSAAACAQPRRDRPGATPLKYGRSRPCVDGIGHLRCPHVVLFRRRSH